MPSFFTVQKKKVIIATKKRQDDFFDEEWLFVYNFIYNIKSDGWKLRI
jgi:hypothetical protein